MMNDPYDLEPGEWVDPYGNVRDSRGRVVYRGYGRRPRSVRPWRPTRWGGTILIPPIGVSATPMRAQRTVGQSGCIGILLAFLIRAVVVIAFLCIAAVILGIPGAFLSAAAGWIWVRIWSIDDWSAFVVALAIWLTLLIHLNAVIEATTFRQPRDRRPGLHLTLKLIYLQESTILFFAVALLLGLKLWGAIGGLAALYLSSMLVGFRDLIRESLPLSRNRPDGQDFLRLLIYPPIEDSRYFITGLATLIGAVLLRKVPLISLESVSSLSATDIVPTFALLGGTYFGVATILFIWDEYLLPRLRR